MSGLARRAVGVHQEMLGLGHEVFDAAGATFVRNRTVPDIRDANHVTRVTAATPEEIARLLARVEVEFAGVPHRRFDLDFTTPPAFEARVALEGYQARDTLVMVLEGALPRGPARVELRPCADAAAWAEFGALKRLAWRERTARLGVAGNPEVGERLALVHRRRSPPARYWLADADGQGRGFIASWEGREGLGHVEDLFVHPGYRRRGLATALIGRGVADCRARGAEGVAILAETADTPRLLYAALGFRPVALTREYVRSVAPGAR